METTTSFSKSQWPELVGTKGVDAVKIIKQETSKSLQITFIYSFEFFI